MKKAIYFMKECQNLKKIVCLSFGIASFFMSDCCVAMGLPEQMSNDEVLAFKMQFQEIAEGYQQNEQNSDSDEDLKLALRLQMEELDNEIQWREEEEEESSEEESSTDDLSNLETNGQEEEEVAADLPNNPLTDAQDNSVINDQEAAEPAADLPNDPVTNAQSGQSQDDDFKRELQEAMRVMQMQNGSNAN